MASSGARPKNIKKGVHVPSRYKEAAEKVSREKSSLMKNTTEMSIFQEVAGRGSQSSRGMTSTPTSTGAFSFPVLDASAVTDSQGHLAVPLPKERIVPTLDASGKINRRKQREAVNSTVIASLNSTVIAASSNKKRSDSFNEKLANAEMDILYAQYLQSAFLLSEAQLALEATSSNAIETLHKLSILVHQHLQVAKSQKKLLALLSVLIEVYEHCQKQEVMLKPVFEVISSLEEKYQNLSEAISVAKHKLLVKDVILPDDDVQEILQEMSDFLSLSFEAISSYKDLVSTSDELETFSGSTELLADALKRGLSLLIEAQELYLSQAVRELGL